MRRMSVWSSGTSFEMSLQMTQEPRPSKRIVADVGGAREFAVHDCDAGLAAERFQEPRHACFWPRRVAAPTRPVGDQPFVWDQIENPSGPARDRSAAVLIRPPVRVAATDAGFDFRG